MEKENEDPIEMKSGFTIIGTMVLDEDNKDSISKALMNRFVAVYLDDYLEINDNNLKIFLENTIKKLNGEFNKNLGNINNENYNEKIPNWYNIKNIKNETKDIINKFIKNKIVNRPIKNYKNLIKRITKLAIIYERINRFGFSIKDCNDFLDLNFDANYEIYKKLQNEILIDSHENKNKFFFDEFKSVSWKMIMNLISSNISNNSIFLQGCPGSGKSCAARHYGAFRSFQNRNPILSVNCHKDLKFYYLVGSYNFKDSQFHFVDGPLLIAIKNGEPILLDEFNLCSENVLINLLLIFKQI